MAYVISEGSLQAIDRAGGRPRMSVSLSGSNSVAYGEIYRKHESVRTVVSFLARNVAQIGLHIYRRVSDLDRERLVDHELAQLLNRPTPGMTAFAFKRAIVSDCAIYDFTAWAKVRGKAGEPQLVRLAPSKVRPVGGNWIRPEKFEVTGSRGIATLDADQVFYFHGYHPDDNRLGLSPIESLRQTLAEEWAAHEMRDQVLRNGARMSGYIERPVGAPWSDAAFERFRDGWRSQYAGDGPEAGGTPILEDGMKFNAVAMSAKDLQYVEVRQLSREEVASAYHVPPPMVGLLDKATFSNITEQHKMLYQDTLGPWLEEMQQEIELQLLSDTSDQDRVYVEFDIRSKLRGSFEEQAAQLQTSVGAPYMTRNEARALANLPSVVGGDELVVPLNVLIGGQASPTDAAPDGALAWRIPGSKGRRVSSKSGATDGQRKKAKQVLAKFYARQEAAVRSALGAKADEGWWDADRWDEELAADLYALAVAVSAQIASSTLSGLGLEPDEYDVDRTLAYLAAVSKSTAGKINATTKQKLDEALAADEPMEQVAHVFEVAKEARSEQAGLGFVAAMAGFAAVEAVKQVAAGRKATKTWLVTSGNPRPSHAVMDGETVTLDELFSNGAKWPGDAVLDVDEIAGCTCDVLIDIP